MRMRNFRTIVLAALSLALAAALFLAYQYRETKTAPIMVAGSTATTAPEPLPAPRTPGPGLAVGDNQQVDVPGGGEMRVKLYDSEGFARGQLVADAWQPLGERGVKVEVTRPRIRMHTPGGQIIDVAAERGIIERRSANLARFEMRNAELRGAVHITIDRLTDEQRKALNGADDTADRAAAETDRFIQLTMDDLFFDLEFARVETAGPFQVRAAEAEIYGRGLSLRYNELDSRVEELHVLNGERIIVWNADDRFRVAGMNASEQQVDVAAEPTPEPSPTPGAVAPDDDLPPLLAEDEPRRPRQRPTDVYVAIFEQAVNVREYEGETVTGRLLADHLRILFDFSQRERDMARQAPPTATGETPSVSPDGDTGEEKTAGAERLNRIELTWSGPLTITSERLATPEGQEPVKPSQRIHLTATGEPVVVDDGERYVECRELVYRDESKAVELTGTAEIPAHVRLEDGGELFGREIVLDRGARRASAKGPGGRLRASGQRGESTLTGVSSGHDPEGDAPLDVHFEDEVVVNFGVAAVERFNLRTGQTEPVEREVLQTAVFTGDVRMARGQERFRGERIEIDFGVDPNGKQYATAVRAYERVIAEQGARYISAGERLYVDFELLEKEQQHASFDLLRARQAVTDRGDDPDAVDWAAVRAYHASRRDYEPALRRLEAVGDAEVRDPGQRLEIDCDLLECRFAEGRIIQSGLVTPRANGRAFVSLGDFSIAAPTPIPFDAIAQTATVEGAGRMTFPSKQDIDGRVLDEPVMVGVQWTQRMAFDGGRNEVVFHGGVRAETQRSQFESSNLRIDFVDVEAAVSDAPAAQTASAGKWWLLQPLIDRAAGSDRSDGLAITGPSLQKKPIYLYAVGDVRGMTANHDAQHAIRSRVHFTGPILAVDLRQRQMLIDGAGTLLMEDYRKSARRGDPSARAAAAADLSPFGRLLGSEASQTFIAWEKSMAYEDARATAEFDGAVTLKHSTGAKMKHAAQLIGEDLVASGRGRQAELTCQVLMVQFARDADVRPDRTAVNEGTSPISGTEVDAFIADGQVYFADSGISAIASRITYSRKSSALEIIGTEDAPAELFDQRKRFSSFKGPAFTWDRNTNRISAPKSRGRVN
jgi:lipopolysaccharide export system protein LptA